MKKITTLLFISLILSNVSVAQQATIQWQKSIGGGLYDYAKEVECTADGGSISIGYTESVDGDISANQGGGDCCIVKTNGAGIVQWKKTYGGTGFDYGYSIKQTPDGYIVAGYSESIDGDVTVNHGAGDCWIIKLDNAGVIEWQNTYGGTLIDNAQSIQLTTDGGYIICGYSESSDGDVAGNHGGGDSWILKLSSAGILQWETTLGGTQYDFAQNITPTSDGGYVIAGGTYSNDGDVNMQNGNGDCWLVKLDNSGSIVWEKSFGGTDYDFGQSVEQTADGGYILAGYSESANGDLTGQHGAGDCWVIKCDYAGNLQWQKALGSSGNDYAYCIQQISGGGYILTGYSELNDGNVLGNHGDYDCWVVLLDNVGMVQQQRSLGGSGLDIGYSVREISAGSYIVAGYSQSNDGDVSGNHGNGDCWIVALNIAPTTITESVGSETILVSSNPGTGSFNFSGLNDKSVIEIYDLSGRMILKKDITENNYTLDLNDQAKAVYLYRVSTVKGENKSGKLILY